MADSAPSVSPSRHPDLFGSVVAYAGEFPSIDEFGRRPDLAEVFTAAFGGDLLRSSPSTPPRSPRPMPTGPGTDRVRLVAATNTPASAGERELREAFRSPACPWNRSPVPSPTGAGRARGRRSLAGLEFAVSRLALARGLDRDGPWVTPPTNRVPRVRHHLFQSRLLNRPWVTISTCPRDSRTGDRTPPPHPFSITCPPG
jgi:hypothetical protein